VSEDALKLLTAYDWPANVRELESVIERACSSAKATSIVPADLPADVRAGIRASRGATDLEIPDRGIDLEELERSLIRKALAKAGGNVSRAARLLGLSRRTLQYRMEKIQGAPEGAPIAPKGAPAS
jgi:transcriptional regulator with PAS, ATPase and Fis domain